MRVMLSNISENPEGKTSRNFDTVQRALCSGPGEAGPGEGAEGRGRGAQGRVAAPGEGAQARARGRGPQGQAPHRRVPFFFFFFFEDRTGASPA